MAIPTLVLDPDNDDLLLSKARAKVTEASNGALDPEHPSVDILLRAQVFLQGEFLWYLNLLPQAVAYEVLAYQSSLERDSGSPARGTATFQLASPRLSSTNIPTGTKITLGSLEYQTVEPGAIASGATETNVLIEATSVGTEHNLGAYRLAGAKCGVPAISAIYNLEPIGGGTGLEPLESFIDRAQRAIRDRQAVFSKTDYELATTDILGFGSRANCVPLLSADKSKEAIGNVHIFAWDTDGNPINDSQKAAVIQGLSPRIPIGTALAVSPGEYDEVRIDAVANVEKISQNQANICYEGLKAYLDFRTYVPGETVSIRRVSHSLWVVGVREVVSTLINENAISLELTTTRHLPKLTQLRLTLVDTEGQQEVYYFGDAGTYLDPD